jgi:hypothetical protein
MEELFRFSVIRPTTKSVPAITEVTGSTASQPVRGKPATPPLQQQLQTLARSLAGDAIDGETLWGRLVPIAAAWLAASGGAIVADALWTALTGLVDDLESLGNPAGVNTVDKAALDTVFAAQPTLTTDAVAAYRPKLSDLFVALMVVRRGGTAVLESLVQQSNLRSLMPLLGGEPTLVEVAATIGVCDIVSAGSAALAPAAGLDAAGSRAALLAAVGQRMSATLMMPLGFLSALRKPVLGVGFRELHVVKQHIRRYEAAEIGRIENILKGELREHRQRHSLSTETDTTVSQSTTTETDKELDTNDHTQVQTQANDQVRTDTKLDAGVHASVSGPSYKIQADLTVSYDKADQSTKQYSTDTAKDVTKKAVSKVTDIITRSQTTKVIEAFVERERQTFDNTKGTGNISGLYQWIEKVYLSQVFNLGRHMLIDITVPEPGANLLAMATVSSVEDPPPIQPQPLGTILRNGDGSPKLDRYGRMQLDKPLNPLDLSPTAINPSTHQPDPNFYGNWVGLYGATGVAPPPDGEKTFSQPKSFPAKDDNDPQGGDQVEIEDGYAAMTLKVSVTALSNDNPDGGDINGQNVYVNVSVAGQTLHLPWPDGQRQHTLQGTLNLNDPATGIVPFEIFGRQINQMDVNVEFIATPQDSKLDQWRLQTYEKIVGAWQTRETVYETAVAATKLMTRSVGPLGSADEDANAAIARLEIKRSSIAIMANSNALVSGNFSPIILDPANPAAPNPPLPLNPDNPQLPEPDLARSQIYGSAVRWFEQAFEWENMAYVLYPYYWGRRSQWIPNLALVNGDAQFLQFLQAGNARVVVPVRLGFEKAVHFYLHTGLPWLGGDLPAIGDRGQNPLYLDVAEEIKALTGGGEPNEIETPIGDPWEYVLPTTLMKLRDDDVLPAWHREVPAGDVGSQWASDAPDGAWTWKDGAPP